MAAISCQLLAVADATSNSMFDVMQFCIIIES